MHDDVVDYVIRESEKLPVYSRQGLYMYGVDFVFLDSQEFE